MRGFLTIFAALAAVSICATAVAAEGGAPGGAAPAIESSPAQPAIESSPAQEDGVTTSDEPAAGDVVVPAEAARESRAARERQDELYESYERLVRVMEIVESRYVQPVDTDQLFDGAIRGIMESLDPYSVYIPAQRYTEFVEETEQQFSGIGITIAVEKDRVMVVATVEGMPAFRAGVQPGDFLLKVNDVPVEQMPSLTEVARALRGDEGTNVTLTLMRQTTGKEFTVVLTREAIPVTTLRGYTRRPQDVQVGLHGGQGRQSSATSGFRSSRRTPPKSSTRLTRNWWTRG